MVKFSETSIEALYCLEAVTVTSNLLISQYGKSIKVKCLALHASSVLLVDQQYNEEVPDSPPGEK